MPDKIAQYMTSIEQIDYAIERTLIEMRCIHEQIADAEIASAQTGKPVDPIWRAKAKTAIRSRHRDLMILQQTRKKKRTAEKAIAHKALLEKQAKKTLAPTLFQRFKNWLCSIK